MSEYTRQWYRVGRDEIRERRKDRMGERDRHICSLADGSRIPDVIDADANLIIAAPELLEALEDLLHQCRQLHGEETQALDFDQALAAIAKAENTDVVASSAESGLDAGVPETDGR